MEGGGLSLPLVFSPWTVGFFRAAALASVLIGIGGSLASIGLGRCGPWWIEWEPAVLGVSLGVFGACLDWRVTVLRDRLILRYGPFRKVVDLGEVTRARVGRVVELSLASGGDVRVPVFDPEALGRTLVERGIDVERGEGSPSPVVISSFPRGPRARRSWVVAGLISVGVGGACCL